MGRRLEKGGEGEGRKKRGDVKFKPIAFLKSLNWGKEDIKKILMFIIMILITCFIIDKFFPVINVRIIQERRLRGSDEKLYIAID